MIVPRYYEDLSVLHENTMPARAYYIPAVSYTHLDVYKRQVQKRLISIYNNHIHIL